MLSCSWWVPALQDVLVADGRSGRAAPRSEGLFFFFPPFYKKKKKKSVQFKSFAFSLVLTI